MVGGQAPKAIRSVECYNFQEDRWYQVADLLSRRCRAGQACTVFLIILCVCPLNSVLVFCPGVVYMAGKVYAVGGFNGSLRVRTVDVYDGARDQWSSVSSMQERRSTLGAAVLGDMLYAVGGFDGSTGTTSHYQVHTKSPHI